MTIDETKTILGIIKTAYPNFYKDMSKNELHNIVTLWGEMFENDNIELVKVATKELINSFQFPPTIADIKDKMYELTANKKTPSELWGELADGLRNGIYNSKAVFEKLSPEIKKFVKNPAQIKELAMMDSDVVHSVVKGQFLKQIESIQKRQEDDYKMLPQSRKIREMINSVGQNINLIGGNE